ncbi:hypothetical protein A1359_02110 [Methylomonas lenta]|uniref:DUF2934 domain-containing protein n=1 Tax=Methylomonas lenta TaxID=980561 RepID=A0A177MWZ8_9GAMM|nr:DUF2934 domain-containing protein [Methylomonas lenta]OAI10105.1 hypothetical protein A1359_02110 [Methylomonas lenta]
MKISKTKETKKYAINPENIVIIQMPYFDDGISRLAYFKAEKRGFVPGYELDDWLQAEQEYIPK